MRGQDRRAPGSLARQALTSLDQRHAARLNALAARGSPAAAEAQGKPLIAMDAESVS